MSLLRLEVIHRQVQKFPPFVFCGAREYRVRSGGCGYMSCYLVEAHISILNLPETPSMSAVETSLHTLEADFCPKLLHLYLEGDDF